MSPHRGAAGRTCGTCGRTGGTLHPCLFAALATLRVRFETFHNPVLGVWVNGVLWGLPCVAYKQTLRHKSSGDS